MYAEYWWNHTNWGENISMGEKHVHDTLITPRSTVLPPKLKCPKLLKKFPTFYVTQRFIAILTTARHLSLF